MRIRTILVPLSGQHSVDDDVTLDPPALQYALRAGARLEAHVEAVCVTWKRVESDPGWWGVLPDYGIGEIANAVERSGEARRKRAHESYVKAVEGASPRPSESAEPGPGFSVHYREVAGEIRATVGELGMLADLTVVASSEARWAQPHRPVLEACLRRTGRPVLVSPPKAATTFATRVALAWNGSVEAARAVTAAMDLIGDAEAVFVISGAEERSTSGDPTGLVRYLAWHGVAAEPVSLKVSKRSSAEAVLAAAQERGSDLIVLGASMRARAHSLLYGSMTDHVMGHPSLPALLVP